MDPVLLDVLKLVVGLCGAWAWPAVVIVLLVLIRKQLTGLIGSLSHLSIKGVEANFGERVAKVKRQTESTVPVPMAVEVDRGADISSELTDSMARIIREGRISEPPEVFAGDLLDFHPRDQIVRGWQRTEGSIYGALAITLRSEQGSQVEPDVRSYPIRQAIDMLGEKASHRVTPEVHEILLTMLRLRDEVVINCVPVTAEIARHYLAAGYRMHIGVFYPLMKNTMMDISMRNLKKEREGKNTASES